MRSFVTTLGRRRSHADALRTGDVAVRNSAALTGIQPFHLGDAGRDTVPYFLPLLAISLGVGLLVARPLAQRLGTRSAVALLLVASLGLIIAATLTPYLGGSSGERVAAGWCDLSRVGFAPLGTLLRVNQVSLNVLLFVPLGLAIGLLPRTPARKHLVVGGFALPVIIEGTQSLVTVLARGCESADVFDNAIGLAIGLAVGLSISAIARRLGCSMLAWRS